FPPSIGTSLNTVKWLARGVQVQAVNAPFPVTEPSAATNDCYFGTITAKSTDTLTLSPATDTTVGDDTPVWRNDLPGWQAAFAAAKANGVGAGRGEVPAGKHNWYSRTVNKSEWTLAKSPNTYSLFPYGTGEKDNAVEFVCQ